MGHPEVVKRHILELRPGLRGERVSIWVGEAKVKVPTSRKKREKWGTRKRAHRTGMDISWLTERIAVGGGIWNPENMAKVAAAGITHIIDMQIEFDDTPL